MEIIKSQKGQDKILYLGFIYRKNTTTQTTQNWRCSIKGCHGSATTPLDYQHNREVRVGREHNHVPEPGATKAAVAVDQMVQEAGNTVAPPRRVISQAIMDLDEEALTQLPKRRTLLKRIQRKRQRMDDDFLPDPPTAEDFIVPDRFKTIEFGGHQERFLLHDDNADVEEAPQQHRIIIFASDAMLNQLSVAATWMCDGTFKYVPKLYYQVYSIHAVRGSNVFPCAYCLLKNKSRETYERVFNILKQHRPDLAPRRISVDFEQAAVRAATNVFPDASVEGCFFHLSQSIWRKLQSIGLRGAYINDDTCRLYCKLLSALAFLPPAEIPAAFEALDDQRDELAIDESVAELYIYFEDTYIGRPQRGGRGRRRPLFPPEMWSVRQRTEDGIPRTNNKLEGWHRALQTMFDCAHPTIYRFLSGLLKEEVVQRANLQQFLAGDEQPERKIYRDVNKRIRTLIQRHTAQEISTTEFLRGVSHNISYNV